MKSRGSKNRVGPILDAKERFISTIAGQSEHNSTWYRFIRRRLPSFLRRIIDPEDILQEACINAAKARYMAGIEDPSGIEAWFRKIILNTILNTWRFYRRGKRVSSYKPIENSKPVGLIACCGARPGEPIALSPTGEEILSRKEEVSRILAAMRELPRNQALLLRYVYERQIPIQQAAMRMGISRRRASQSLYRAKKNLRIMILRDSSRSSKLSS